MFAAAVVVTVVLLGGLASSTAIHSSGEADCSVLDSNTTEPEHGAHDSDMYVGEDGANRGCPVDDGARMGETNRAA